MIVGVLGASGFLGINLMQCLEDNGIAAIPGSRRLSGTFKVDAASYENLKLWISGNQITHVVNLAAMCGGIGLNKTHPYRLWSETTRITANVIDACLAEDVKKLVMIGTVCSYAAECPVPFQEQDLMNYGMPEPTNRAYGVAKLNGLIGAQAAITEFGINISNLIPVNMYGPHDHFDLDNSHVIPAMIRKIDDAINSGDDLVEVWGSGIPTREFLYVKDCAIAIFKALNIDTGSELINIGTGQEIQINSLVELIGDIMGYKGGFKWDNNKPNGQMRRQLNVERANNLLNFRAKTDLKDGIAETVSWYRQQRS